MGDDKRKTQHNGKVDYSSVTPATGTRDDNLPIADSFANNMPTADSPSNEGTIRTDPDKVIPGPEAATGVDELEEDSTCDGNKG